MGNVECECEFFESDVYYLGRKYSGRWKSKKSGGYVQGDDGIIFWVSNLATRQVTDGFMFFSHSSLFDINITKLTLPLLN